ncbi:MAG: hypothetical protein ACRCTI_10055, partial [Beijerinckiaceae bacterium]
MAAGKGVERSGVAVIVPTTAGAIKVLGLRWSQRIPSSRVVLGNETSDQCELWTKDYNSLLRPGDPMRALLGLPDGGGCRLVVSDEIDHGRSWIVPVAAAHFADARAQAVHADIARARMMIWGTGAIDFSQPENADQAKIVENDYHLTGKIDLSREHFATAAHDGTPVLCLLPAGPDAERAAGILKKVLGQQPHHVEIVKSLADIIRPIEAYLNKGNFNAPPDMKYAPVPYTPPPENEVEPEAEEASVAKPAAAARTTEKARPAAPPPPQPTAESPPVYGAKAQPPRPPGGPAADPGPLAGTPPAARGSGLSMGLLGAIAAGLVAVIGVGGLMLRTGTDPAPATPQPVLQPQPQPPQQRPQVVTIPQQPSAPQQAASASPQVAPPPPAQPGQPPATPNPPAQPVVPDPAGAVGRLTILTPPAGSSCQAQVL